jgi:pre-mRNA-splicing factor ATP-dependent RNA helicase DHX38/PRP16
LKEVREQQERQKMRKKFWELGGSTMGSLIGVQPTEEDKANAAAEDGENELDENGEVCCDLEFASTRLR